MAETGPLLDEWGKLFDTTVQGDDFVEELEAHLLEDEEVEEFENRGYGDDDKADSVFQDGAARIY
jgi:hypothetical protein